LLDLREERQDQATAGFWLISEDKERKNERINLDFNITIPLR
jgi:hypothetical protein